MGGRQIFSVASAVSHVNPSGNGKRSLPAAAPPAWSLTVLCAGHVLRAITWALARSALSRIISLPQRIGSHWAGVSCRPEQAGKPIRFNQRSRAQGELRRLAHPPGRPVEGDSTFAVCSRTFEQVVPKVTIDRPGLIPLLFERAAFSASLGCACQLECEGAGSDRPRNSGQSSGNRNRCRL